MRPEDVPVELVEKAADAICERCYGQELPEAPIDLARAALAAVLPECAVAWDQGYTWGCNDSQNETETKNPYRATTTEGTTT